ncbi:MAG TPA: hypothetical protein VFS05_14820 [Gemmatimonadaceae bacterium]|nr:hypothetical protein [Gemmatimonadaceae bacterium]
MTMLINLRATLAGIPMGRLRQLARVFAWSEGFGVSDVAEYLAVGRRRAAAVVRALEEEGYLERRESPRRGAEYKLARKGISLAAATAAPPMHRRTADRILATIIERARALEDWTAHPYAYAVGELLVFGSYLRDVPRLNDLDLAVAWRPRREDDDWILEAVRQRAAAARDAGRVFGSLFREMVWPKDEVQLYLLRRIRMVRMQDLADRRDFVLGQPHRVVYRFGQPPAPSPAPPNPNGEQA